ncbi:MAG: FAD-dependent oxidoreductase [Chloroflexi bacterium]|nr:FAD-dependent oxidoreductase [Chloroflexota bacterium]
MGRATSIPLNRGSSDGAVVDVAIVGGGVAGLYAAWRLATARAGSVGEGAPFRVALIEATDRIGGRIETVSFPGLPTQRAEFGAMRIATWQRLTLSLAEALGLPLVDFPMGDDQNFWYVRGTRLQRADLTDPAKVPYRLEGEEVGRSPQELLDRVAARMLGDHPIPTDRHQWDRLKRTLRYRGRPAREFGFWNLLADSLSPEAVHFVEDTVGFGTMTQNWNAVEALQLLYADFGQDVRFLGFAGGTDRLPAALARAFTAAGGEIYCGNALTRIDAGTGDGGVVLTVSNRRSGTSWRVAAHHTICALPRRALELLGQTGSLLEPFPFADPAVLELVGSVHRFPAFKLFLAYEEPWWRELGITSGRSVTDLPIRQTYYFGVDDTDRALLMASYDDDRTVAYWQGLAWTERDEPSAPRLEADSECGASEAFVAPPEMVRHAQAQLARMHGLDLPTPYLAAYRNWAAAPYGGAWHVWRANADSIAVGIRMRRPLPEWNVHVCGEAYSGIQGFIEGALTSTELVLQEQLGLPPPPWLPSDYYVGPRG